MFAHLGGTLDYLDCIANRDDFRFLVVHFISLLLLARLRVWR